jgi:S-adenosyl methyltransferase
MVDCPVPLAGWSKRFRRRASGHSRAGWISRVAAAVPSGSYLAISLGASDLVKQETMQSIADPWNSRSQQRVTWRSREQVARFFDGLDLIEPGLVPVEEWRPEPGATDEGKSIGWCAVARKP